MKNRRTGHSRHPVKQMRRKKTDKALNLASQAKRILPFLRTNPVLKKNIHLKKRIPPKIRNLQEKKMLLRGIIEHLQVQRKVMSHQLQVYQLRDAQNLQLILNLLLKGQKQKKLNLQIMRKRARVVKKIN